MMNNLSFNADYKNTTQSNLKLLLWSPAGSGLDYGGPGMSAYRLFKSQQDGSLDISLVHGRAMQKEYPLFKNTTYLNPTQHKRSAALSIFTQLQFIRRGKHWLRENVANFDAFYGLEGFHITVAPALFAQSLGLSSYVKIVQSHSDLAEATGLKRWLRAAQKRREMIKQLSGVVAISKEIVSELQSYGVPDSKIFFIPNGVDTNLFHPVSQAQKRALKAKLNLMDLPTVMFSGGLIRRKRPHLLIEAAGLLKRQNLDVQLVFVGPAQDAEYHARLVQLSEQLGVAERIKFVGFTKDIAPFYQASDAFCLPSEKEGMPNALLEAMASGLPSIATPVSGVFDIIKDGENGLILNEVEKLSQSLYELLSNKDYADTLASRARERIVADFSSAVVYQRQKSMFLGSKESTVAMLNG